MGVLMIRAGEHPCDEPATVIVLESEVAEYQHLGWALVGADPGEEAPLNPPRWKESGDSGE